MEWLLPECYQVQGMYEGVREKLGLLHNPLSKENFQSMDDWCLRRGKMKVVWSLL